MAETGGALKVGICGAVDVGGSRAATSGKEGAVVVTVILSTRVVGGSDKEMPPDVTPGVAMLLVPVGDVEVAKGVAPAELEDASPDEEAPVAPGVCPKLLRHGPGIQPTLAPGA